MKSKKIIKRIYNVVIIALLLCGIGYVCSRFVHLGNVEYTNDARVGRHIAPVNNRVQGFISEIRFEEYQHVNRGDTLVVLDNSEYLYRLWQAQADLEGALSGNSADAASIRTTESNVTVAEAAVELAKLDLSYTVIVAPCSGRVGRKDIHPGQLMQPGQLLAQVVDDSEVWIIADYRETQLKHIRVGSEVKIKADALPGVEYRGRVQAISSATGSAWSGAPINNATGNFVKVEQRVPVRIAIEGGDNLSELKAGLNVETEVLY